MNRKERRAGHKTGQTASGGAQDALALHARGVEAYRAGQLQTAADLIARAIAADGQRPDFHYNLAIVLRAQNRLKDAAASYERAIRLKPDYADAHNNLGNVLKAMGKPDTARASFARALHCRPDNADSHYNLGVLCSETGDAEEAAGHLQRCLDLDPDDSRGARMLLAQLGRGTVPERTSEAQLLNIYGVRSRFWDRESAYFGHLLVAEGLRKCAGSATLDILDIGCGTGLVGALVRAQAGRLDGVDLSPAMLEKAQAKGLYDRLERGDFVALMSQRRAGYDAVLGAAALIHVGNLQEIFRAAAICLRKNGLFIFTLFPGGPEDFAVTSHPRLAQSGCFAHNPDYVRRLAAACGFGVEMLEGVVHEHDQDGNPVAGLLAVLRAS
jgi:predicted TPR repeat methyltransferase